MRRADRLFQLVQILRRDRITTAKRLAAELGVGERTVYRDVSDLSALGVPIESEAGVGYRLPRQFELPPLMFTVDEVEALATGARIARSWGDPALAEAARSAIDKIENVLPPALKVRLAASGLYAPGFHVPKAMARPLGELRAAVRERRKVRVRYAKAPGDETERVLRPLGLFFWGTTWSLAAWCELRSGFRTFRLDRIGAVERLAERFDPAEGERLEDYLRAAEGS